MMKVLITTCALVFLFSIFTLFQHDNNSLIRYQEQLKYEADNCADAAALYYDDEKFADGIKIFNKDEGNKAIKYIIKKNLDLDDSFVSSNYYLRTSYEYFTYYIDGDGTVSSYKEDTLISYKEDITFPYVFRENLTGFETTISEATVILTINAGKFDYKLNFINDPDLVRTSGYEYQQNQ